MRDEFFFLGGGRGRGRFFIYFYFFIYYFFFLRGIEFSKTRTLVLWGYLRALNPLTPRND